MASFFAFSTLFHLRLTFFRPEVPFKSTLLLCDKNIPSRDTSFMSRRRHHLVTFMHLGVAIHAVSV